MCSVNLNVVACLVNSEQVSDEDVKNPKNAQIFVEQFLKRLRDCAVILGFLVVQLGHSCEHT